MHKQSYLKIKHIVHINILLFICFACQDNSSTTPKPIAFLSLNYPKAQYLKTTEDINYQFEISDLSDFYVNANQWGKIVYPKLDAEIVLTYQPVENNLKTLIGDAEKTTYKHTIKADQIEVYPYEHLQNKVYARLFNLTGDVASPIQFQATDSIKHFLYGSLYFKTKPNYDSIQPAIDYLKKDIEHLIETIQWKEIE